MHKYRAKNINKCDQFNRYILNRSYFKIFCKEKTRMSNKFIDVYSFQTLSCFQYTITGRLARQTDVKVDRRRGRQTPRQINVQVDRHPGRQTSRQTEAKEDRRRGRQTSRQTDVQVERRTGRQTSRQADVQVDRRRGKSCTTSLFYMSVEKCDL